MIIPTPFSLESFLHSLIVLWLLNILFEHTKLAFSYCLFLLFDLRIVEKEMCNEVWNLLLRNNWWNSRKKEKKEKCDYSHLSNWMKLPRNWIGWMVEIGCNQTKDDLAMAGLVFLSHWVREMRFSLVSIPFIRHFSNDFCKSRSI